MDDVANTNGVVEKRSIRNAKVGVEVGEHIVESRVSEEKETEEARRYVDRRAKRQRWLDDGLNLSGILQLVVYSVNVVVADICRHQYRNHCEEIPDGAHVRRIGKKSGHRYASVY